MINVTLKMLLATIIGALVGYERTLARKHAGIRTHSLLCLATCSLTLLVEEMLPEETMRVVSGIVQGVGFLGAGVIFKTEINSSVKGLTSSVILWLVAVMGIICGSKCWYFVIPLIFCYLLSVTVFNKFEKRTKEKLNEKQEVK